MDTRLPLISIIVPVYNVAPYLAQCFDSITNQTYQNIEIIFVDDGSTDDSGRLCDDFASGDSRVTVIHKQNGGQAQARNVGMAVAHGEYLMFIDSDDWVDTNICEMLFDAIVKNGAQASMCAYVREYPDKSLVREICSEDTVLSGKELQRRLCGPVGAELRYPEKMDCYNSMCGKLYPSSALKDKCVTDLSLIGPSEDLLYNFVVFADVESVVYINQPYYHYRKEVSTSTTATYRPDLLLKWNALYDIMEDIIHKTQLSDIYSEALNNRIAIHMLGLGLNCMSGSGGALEKSKRIKAAMNEGRRKQALKQLSLKHMPSHWKLFYFCAKYNLSFMMYLLLVVITRLKGKV